MLTNNDIVKLSKVLATKSDIENLDGRLVNVENTVNSHTVVLDVLVKKVDSIDIEQKVMRHRLERHESWLMLIAGKIGIKLKH